MTERWRKKLEGIDQVGPNDDLYERAKNGPNLPEPQSPMNRTSTRVVTAIAAFVVFALGISVFAIPALRLHGESSALSSGGQVQPLWPARTTDEVQALQAQADAGDASWALDPREVATRFGRSVVGWPDAWAGELLPASLACGVVPGDFANSLAPDASCSAEPLTSGAGYASSPGCDPTSFLLCGGETSGDPSTGVASPFVTYLVGPCDLSYCKPALLPLDVTLVQPGGSGPGNVWAVLDAADAGTELSVGAGQTVANGSSVSVGLRVPLGDAFGFGLHVGAGDGCDVNIATDAYHSAGPNDLITAAGSQLEVDLSPRPATCQQEEPGYVFVATSKRTIVSGGVAIDPLQGAGGTGLELISFAAVPITFEWSDTTASTPSPSSTISASPTEATGGDWKTHASGLGFTIDVPTDWGITDATDELIVSAPGGDPYVQINRVPNDPLRDDSSFPLDYTAMANDPRAPFRGDGQAFIIQWLTGDGSAPTPEQAAEFDRITSSIAFPATELGATENGLTAVAPILQSASAQWVIYKLTGDHYIAALSGGSSRSAFGPAPTCSGGDGSYEVRETGVAGISCPDGTGGDWDFTTGVPKAGNSTGFDLPLHEWPAVRSWDGWLLVQFPTGATPSPSPP